jgi:hypothetical protein
MKSKSKVKTITINKLIKYLRHNKKKNQVWVFSPDIVSCWLA